MRINTSLFIMGAMILFPQIVLSSQFIYQPANSTNDPARKIIYKVGISDITEINNDTGLWSLGYAPRVPGEPILLFSGTSFAGVVHQSNLQDQYLCGSSKMWNWISGDEYFRQDVESTMVIPFQLDEPATIKIDYSGLWNFVDTVNNGVLSSRQHFILTEGLTGSGDEVIRLIGGGIEYLDLPEGSYRISTGISNNLVCDTVPVCNKTIAGGFRLMMQIIDSAAVIGSSEIKPFVADQMILNEDVDQIFVDTSGALIYQAESQNIIFNDQSSGWYELNMQSSNLIETINNEVIESIEFPSNRPGTFYVKVNEIYLGQYEAGDSLVFSDFSAELGNFLVTGINMTEGVESVAISYRRGLAESFIGGCRLNDRLAVKLVFDTNTASIDSTSVYLPDPIFTSLFE